MFTILEMDKILKQKRYLSIFLISLLPVSLAFGLATNIILPFTLEINFYIEPFNTLLIFIIVILISLNVTALVYRLDSNQSLSNSKSTLFGSFLGLFASACPVCAPFILLWLGLGSLGAILSQFSSYIAILSIFFLILSLNRLLKLNCEVKIHGKSN